MKRIPNTMPQTATNRNEWLHPAFVSIRRTKGALPQKFVSFEKFVVKKHVHET